MCVCAFDSNAALVIVPDLGRPVLGEFGEDMLEPGEATTFLATGVVRVLTWVVAALVALAGAVGAAGRAAGFVVGRETQGARES